MPTNLDNKFVQATTCGHNIDHIVECFCVLVNRIQNTPCRSYDRLAVSYRSRPFPCRVLMVASHRGGSRVVKRIFFSTGELSGDLQGSILIRALKQEAENRNVLLQLYGLGGPLMKQEGLQLLQDTSKVSSIGLIEAFPHLWTSWNMIQKAIQQAIDDPPVRGLTRCCENYSWIIWKLGYCYFD